MKNLRHFYYTIRGILNAIDSQSLHKCGRPKKFTLANSWISWRSQIKWLITRSGPGSAWSNWCSVFEPKKSALQGARVSAPRWTHARGQTRQEWWGRAGTTHPRRQCPTRPYRPTPRQRCTNRTCTRAGRRAPAAAPAGAWWVRRWSWLAPFSRSFLQLIEYSSYSLESTTFFVHCFFTFEAGMKS